DLVPRSDSDGFARARYRAVRHQCPDAARRSRENAVEFNIVVVRKAQADAQLLAARSQSPSSDVVIARNPHQIRKLGRVLPDRAQDRGNIRRAVATQPQSCSGWQNSVSVVEDDAARGKGDSVLGRDFCSNMRFHVDRSRPSFIMELKLFTRAFD